MSIATLSFLYLYIKGSMLDKVVDKVNTNEEEIKHLETIIEK